jgi:4-hydroxy-tetrahydrodipicolinate reductase
MSAVSPLNGDATLNDVPIESIREGEVPGTHEVKWDSEEDTIIITHIAKGRRGFALGAVLAAESLV